MIIANFWFLCLYHCFLRNQALEKGTYSETSPAQWSVAEHQLGTASIWAPSFDFLVLQVFANFVKIKWSFSFDN